MKLSIAWIFDHIESDWKQLDIPELVHQFNLTTAEIEGFEHIKLDENNLVLGQVRSVAAENVVTSDTNTVEVYCQELGKSFELPVRADLKMGQFFILKKIKGGVTWARTNDVGSSKDFVLPAVDCGPELCDISWKKLLEVEDYIIEVDNKSITNRPDMWSHRGFAREIAALLDVPFKPLDAFLADKKVVEYERVTPVGSDELFDISIDDPGRVKRFAALYVQEVEPRASLLWMAHRLARVDSKPIDMLVDLTNYVMLDVGQPMHAFDADKIAKKTIMPRMAYEGEKLTLLDGDEVELTSEDIVIANSEQPIALGGVMGGQSTMVDANTKSLLLESANFSATVVRRTAARHKKRTDASARFEKTLDPNQNILALHRFLKVLDNEKISYKCSEPIISLGAKFRPVELVITHDFIERRLGATLEQGVVMRILTRLEFEVTANDGTYIITVPTFRSTKDVTIKEDIVEEVGRFYGYMNLDTTLPHKEATPNDISATLRTRLIKKTMAHALCMREVYNYALFDESFLQAIKWNPGQTAAVQNPVSENWQSLVTTLIPHLIKNVVNNQADHEHLRFFEWARTWELQKNDIKERRALAGIVYDRKKDVDFYTCKALLEHLFDVLRLPVTFERVDNPEHPWFAPYQTAHIKYHDTVVGTAGLAHPLFMRGVVEGSMFMFEVDGDFLRAQEAEPIVFKELPKYPEVERDVSMMIPVTVTVDQLAATIKAANDQVTDVSLVDFFEKPEWKDERAVTVRFVLGNLEKTLTKDEVDDMYAHIAGRLQKLGATIR